MEVLQVAAGGSFEGDCGGEKVKPKVYFVDGGTRNQGDKNRITWESYGSFCDDDGHVTHFELPQAATNNEAEYMALIELLKTLPDNEKDEVLIYTDSRLLVGHLERNWKVKAKNLRLLVVQALFYLGKTNAHLKWVERKVIVQRLGH